MSYEESARATTSVVVPEPTVEPDQFNLKVRNESLITLKDRKR